MNIESFDYWVIKSLDDIENHEIIGAIKFKPDVHRLFLKKKIGNDEILKIGYIKTKLLKEFFDINEDK